MGLVLALVMSGLIGLSGLAERNFQPLEPLEVKRYYGHSSPITAVALSPDQTQIVSSSPDAIIVWDTKSGMALHLWPQTTVALTVLAISSTGRLIGVTQDGTVKLWMLETGTLEASWSLDGGVQSMQISPDGRFGLFQRGDLWTLRDLRTGAQGGIPDVRVPSRATPGFGQSVLLGPDGLRLFVVTDGTVSAIGSGNGQVVWRYELGVRPAPALALTKLGSLALSHSGRRLAVGSSDGLVILDATTGALELELQRGWSVGVLRWNDDDTRLASTPVAYPLVNQLRDATTVWNAVTGARLLAVDGSEIVSFGDETLTTLWDQVLMRWDTQTQTEQTGIELGNDATGIRSLGNDQILVQRGASFSLVNGRTGQPLEFEGFSLTDLAVSPDGKTLAVSGANGRLSLLNSDSLLERQRLEIPQVPQAYMGRFIHQIAFSPDGHWLAAAVSDNNTYIWSLQNGKIEATLSGAEADQGQPNRQNWRSGFSDPGLRGFARCLAWSPDSKQLAVGYEARGIGIWDVGNQRVTQRLLGHTGWVLSLDWRVDGQQLLSAAGDGTVRFWQLSRGTATVRRVNTKFVRSVRYAPDGARAASASGDGTVIIWDAKTTQATKRLSSQNSAATSLRWSPEGRHLVTGWSNGQVQIWDADAGVMLQSLGVSNSLILNLEMPSHGSTLLIGSRENTLSSWGHVDGSPAFGGTK